MNENRFFTINSQPQINGVPSTDPVYGWGPVKGYVFQKAYFEFFLPPELIYDLSEYLRSFDTISFQAVNIKGDEIHNVEPDEVNAVTWGVFPRKEIVQPTVVDPRTFLIWKDEAFSHWMDKWATIYDKDSKSHEYLQSVHDSYFLVNVVENDFINGNLSEILCQFIDKNQELIKSIV